MLILKNIYKSFPGVKALQDVSMEFYPGKVHALCGENGAGKSTLMNIICGNLQQDSGQINLNGTDVMIEDVLAAESKGIAIVYQERSLVESLTVAENIFPVHPPKTNAGFIDYKTLQNNTTSILQKLRIQNIFPGTAVRHLSASQKEMIEIGKALAKKPSILILDEPTASLTQVETSTLFSIIKELKKDGVIVIYISHRMAEIKEIADVVSVLKDGTLQGTVPATTPIDQIVKMMVGREIKNMHFDNNTSSKVLLKVEHLCGAKFSDVSFTVYSGEILGFAGISGSGRTAIAQTIFGEIKSKSGKMMVKGKPYSPSHPQDAIKCQIAYLPNDRRTEGLFIENSLSDNIASVHLNESFLFQKKYLQNTAETYINQLSIKTQGTDMPVRLLSGGNQQKAVLAKWLSIAPELLIVNEPTHGVDVGAKAEIYYILKNLTRKGKGIIIISSELPELLSLADRIAVMHQGRLMGIISKEKATEEKIALLASGIV